jgi:hypothetical protein
MISVEELFDWLSTKRHCGHWGPNGFIGHSSIAIDEGGLTLVEIGADGKPTGHEIEVGGVREEGS